MPEELTDPRLNELRGALAARDAARAAGTDVPEDEAERLARALLDAPPPGLTCEAVEAQLPEFLEAELRSAKLTEELAAVAAHVRACSRCGPLYADALDAELSPAPAVRLTAQQEAAVLDLVRTPEQRARLAFEGYVSRVTARIAVALQPRIVPDLGRMSKTVFEKIRVAPPNLPPAAALGALGRGAPRLPAAAAYLAATYLAAQQLDRMSDTRLAQLRAEGRLEETIRQIGKQAAIDATMRGNDAVQFADQFARLIVSGEEPLPRVAG